MTGFAKKTTAGTRYLRVVEMKLLPIPFCVILLLAMIGCADTDPAQMSEAALRATGEVIHDAVLTIDSHDDISFDFASPPMSAARS